MPGTRPVVIGLLGRAGSGKTTAARFLEERYHARVFSFAGPLKDLAKIVWGFSEEQVRGTQAQKEAVDSRWGISPRETFIRLGEGAREALYDRVWIDVCFERIRSYLSGCLAYHVVDPARRAICVVDDVRHMNEAQAIVHSTQFCGFVVKLVYSDGDSSEFVEAPSEKSVDACPVDLIFEEILSSRSPNASDLKGKLVGVVERILCSEKASGI